MQYTLELAMKLVSMPGFYDFIDENGGCDMVIVRNNKVCGSIDANFKARSDSKEIVPDFRDERAITITDLFLKEHRKNIVNSITDVVKTLEIGETATFILNPI